MWLFCGQTFLKSIWTQSEYAKKQIWAGSLNNAIDAVRNWLQTNGCLEL